MYMTAVLIISKFVTESMAAMIYALAAGCHFVAVAKNGGAFLLHTMHVRPNGSLNESEQFANLWKCNIISSTLPLLALTFVHFFIPEGKASSPAFDSGENHDATHGSIWRRYLGYDDYAKNDLSTTGCGGTANSNP